jgi:fibronectin-binding autotransporter adhesin
MANATWRRSPVNADYNNGQNWSGGFVPDGTAFFGASSIIVLNITAAPLTTVGGWSFKANASDYAFWLPSGRSFYFLGAGIVVDGGSVSISNGGVLAFAAASTAGKAEIVNSAEVFFLDDSTGGTAKIRNFSVATVQFLDDSSAGRARITNEGSFSFEENAQAGAASITNAGALSFEDQATGGRASIANNNDIDFLNNSTAGGSAIVNNGLIQFWNFSNAGTAKIVNKSSLVFLASSSATSASVTNNHNLVFNDSTSAGAAAITNNASLTFNGASKGGSAIIVTTEGAGTSFWNFSNPEAARLIVQQGGFVDFSNTTGSLGDSKISAGSIEGAGQLDLGNNALTVGSNNRSTTMTGLIIDDGAGSMVKVGTGTLKLGHIDNTYDGGTTIVQGALSLAAKGAAGTGGIVFSAGKQTLIVANKALVNHDLDNSLFNLGFGDVLDLPGLDFVRGKTKAIFDGTTLTVRTGKVADTFTLINPDSGRYVVRSDGHGGTKVILTPLPAKAFANPDTDSFVFNDTIGSTSASASIDHLGGDSPLDAGRAAALGVGDFIL